jgi:DUF917 family protein
MKLLDQRSLWFGRRFKGSLMAKMNLDVARRVLLEKVEFLRRQPVTDLLSLLDSPRVLNEQGEDAKRYQVELSAVWDDSRKRNLRIFVSVDDGGISAFKPLTDSFLFQVVDR